MMRQDSALADGHVSHGSSEPNYCNFSFLNNFWTMIAEFHCLNNLTHSLSHMSNCCSCVYLCPGHIQKKKAWKKRKETKKKKNWMISAGKR